MTSTITNLVVLLLIFGEAANVISQSHWISGLETLMKNFRRSESLRENAESLAMLLLQTSSLQRLNYYMPFWPGGESAYLQPSPPSTTESTTWLNYTSDDDLWVSVTMSPFTTEPYNLSSTPKSMQYYRDCTNICVLAYSMDYGPVCGFRIDKDFVNQELNHQFKQFKDICELETANCGLVNFRPGWKILHRGECPEVADRLGSHLFMKHNGERNRFMAPFLMYYIKHRVSSYHAQTTTIKATTEKSTSFSTGGPTGRNQDG